MVEWWNAGMVEWWNGAMVEWWNGRMVEWWNGEKVKWWNSGLRKGGIVEYSRTSTNGHLSPRPPFLSLRTAHALGLD